MGSSPKVPKSEAEKPAILTTARDGLDSGTAGTEASTFGRKKLRMDLNNATQAPYGSSLVVPT